MLAGVSAWDISRIGTSRSGRLPCTYTLREFGNGLTAAASTCAESAVNFGAKNCGLAFIVMLLKIRKASGRCFPTTALPVQVQRVYLTPLIRRPLAKHAR